MIHSGQINYSVGACTYMLVRAVRLCAQRSACVHSAVWGGGGGEYGGGGRGGGGGGVVGV